MRLNRDKIRRIKTGLLPKAGKGYRFVPLADYYDSSEWLDLRDQALRRDGGACAECGSRYDLEVHHNKYPQDFFLGKQKYINVEDDALEKLVTLCNEHHAYRHAHLAPKFEDGDENRKPHVPYQDDDAPEEIDFRRVGFESRYLDEADLEAGEIPETDE